MYITGIYREQEGYSFVLPDFDVAVCMQFHIFGPLFFRCCASPILVMSARAQSPIKNSIQIVFFLRPAGPS